MSGPELGRSVELDNQPFELGRDPDCRVVLTAPGVSRKHARVQLIFALYFVSDLESTNGTFVNDERVNMQQLKDGDQIRVGESVLKFVANQLEIQYTKKVLDLATTDGLTGLPNKQQFDVSLERTLLQAQQSGKPLCLVLLDVDHFKAINDQLGHTVGDRALSHTAGVVAAALPTGSSLYRVGGEEFAVLLPDRGHAEALAEAEGIRRAVAESPVMHDSQRIRITISLGVAEVGPGEPAAELYGRADALLYGSKRAGRNRVS